MTLSIDVVYPHLPPAVNGIGDHSVILARALARQGHRVRVLGALAAGQSERLRLDAGVEAVDAWPTNRLADTGPLVETLVAGSADVVVLQFEQFSYGVRGWNPSLSRLLGELRKRAPSMCRVLFAHENYTYPGTLGHTVMWAYQRRQFLRLVGDSERLLVTTEAWADRDGLSGAVVVPVFSNLPEPASSVPDLGHGTVVWFGYLDARRLPYFETAVAVLRGRGRRLVYVGVDGALARAVADRAGHDVLTVFDALPAVEVSRVLQEASLVLAPFPDGVSSRRGTVMAALQHGRSLVTNRGPSTDAVVRDLIEQDVLMAAEDATREAFGRILTRSLDRATAEVVAQGTRAAAIYAARFSPDIAARALVAAIRS